ncbi:DUF2846 domain-containing protein [Pseudoalteromonas byunsanensis]|uniref:DUF2846 domain-containing protein n=1 Tax=Pseudoalteromonas byunsanensis TaxID=327939 RepID=A0A1S1N6I7_9GAMM|nr:DUF2846 domain-containing protein [Pseudoalteromonas byunsanensis]OHU94942.1 hypothetical protein BIW53_13060 [Pseudoalteromonas byunsanensis]
MRNRVLCLFVAILISGCVATGEKFKGELAQPNDKASFYLYRPAKFFQGGAWPTVFINGEDRFTLKNGGYVHTYLPAGTHHFKIAKGHFLSNWIAGDLEFTVEVEPGKQYFYRFDIDFDNFGGGGNYISISGSIGVIPVTESEAFNSLSELRSSM